MLAIPGLKKVVEDVEKYPNSLLEKIIKENALGGIKRFGVRKPVDPAFISFFRFVIMDRVRNGLTLEAESVRNAKKMLMGSFRYKIVD
jgi:hypothetical protein